MAHERFKTVLLFGAPGAGKGTQGKILGSVPGFFHLSCGDVFRELDINSELGKVFVHYSSRGELVPDETTVDIWRSSVKARTVLGQYRPHSDILVLDGIPRNVRQAELLAADLDVLKVVHLFCEDKEIMIDRLRRRALKENRADDAREDVILRRWEVYEVETKPVIDFYPRDRILLVDGTQRPLRVLQEIIRGVADVQEKHFQRAAP